MAKKLTTILKDNPSIDYLRGKGAKDFARLHKVEFTDDPNNNDDAIFKGRSVSPRPRGSVTPESSPKDSYGSGGPIMKAGDIVAKEEAVVEGKDHPFAPDEKLHFGFGKAGGAGFNVHHTKTDGDMVHGRSPTKGVFGYRTFKAHKTKVTKGWANEEAVVEAKTPVQKDNEPFKSRLGKSAGHSFLDPKDPRGTKADLIVDPNGPLGKALIKKRPAGTYKGIKFEDVEYIAEAGMTRKHFQQVANTVRAIEDPKKRQEFSDHHAAIFAAANPRFDYKRWHAAAGTTNTHNESVNEGKLLSKIKAIGAKAKSGVKKVVKAEIQNWKNTDEEVTNESKVGDFVNKNIFKYRGFGKQAKQHLDKALKSKGPTNEGIIDGIKKVVKKVKTVNARPDLEDFLDKDKGKGKMVSSKGSSSAAASARSY